MGEGPAVDVDMGIGRQFGYRDAGRLGAIVVHGHVAVPPVVDRHRVGAAMARLRRAAGASQDAVAAVLAVSKHRVSRWERGCAAPPPAVVRARWADICAAAAAGRAGGRSS